MSKIKCPDGLQSFIGDFACVHCPHNISNNQDMVTICELNTPIPKGKVPPKKSDVGKLKALLNLIGESSPFHKVLNKTIKILDNPLGVLKGDYIRVWDNNRPSDCYFQKFTSYDEGKEFPWKTKQAKWNMADTFIDIPELTLQDLAFFHSLVEDIPKDKWEELKKILGGKKSG
jgi:hypothetical protein